jgi:hypothetical protein
MPEPNQWETFNQEVLQWGFRTRNLLKGSIASLSMKGKGELVRSLQMKTKKDSGEIDRIIFSFHRHGVFFHKGVGRGYIILSGRVIRGHRLESKPWRIPPAMERARSFGVPSPGLHRSLKRRSPDWRISLHGLRPTPFSMKIPLT